MTRSMVFTNTSNWDGEDYVLRSSGDTKFFKKDGFKQVEVDQIILKPGESQTVYPAKGEAFTFEPVESKEIEPFYMNGRQMTPSSRVSFG